MDLFHRVDKKARPDCIPGWPVEPEIFTGQRRKSIAKRPYLVRHPKMEFKAPGTGPGVSIACGNGGADPRDSKGVNIAVETRADTPRPENPFYSDQELQDLAMKVEVFKIIHHRGRFLVYFRKFASLGVANN